uniref:Uncharacterized protein LOC114346153 n=1 Tax=Diabrotica virgifera virgifera TaxID=50390 RepID=A0A6P7GTB0_DIAVI
MPRHCSVPNCKSNYATTLKHEQAQSTFSFPKNDQLRNQWVRSINRENFTVTASSVVCKKHFDSSDIIETESFIDKNGTVLHRNLTYPKLKENAIPRIFENQPSYLSNPKPPTRKNPETRRAEISLREENNVKEFENEDLILDFNQLVQHVSEKIELKKWQIKVVEERICFYLLNIDSHCSDKCIKVISNINITKELLVSVYMKDIQLSPQDLKWILPFDCKLSRWSQLENMLSRYSFCFESLNDNNFKITNICSEIDRVIENTDIDKIKGILAFVKNQLMLLTATRAKYSLPTVLFALTIYNQSTSCYNIIRQYLNLPTKRYLQMITSSFHVSPDDQLENNYLSYVASNLNDREKVVNLLVDEIYVNPGVHYHSQQITGFAANNDKQLAKTIVTLMISSAFAHFKEVVRLVPVCNIAGDELKHLVLQSIQYIQDCGFKVLCVITDNNRLNQNMFGQLSPQFCITNPKFNNENIYLLYDFVHVFKNIRNNWLNKKDTEKTFIFPDFNHSVLRKSFVKDLRTLYQLEINYLTKRAYKLNHKSVYPNNFERQKVSLVENIFHETTIAALRSCSIYTDTASFLEIIRNWWSIINVKTKFKGQAKRNDLATPIFSDSDSKLVF